MGTFRLPRDNKRTRPKQAKPAREEFKEKDPVQVLLGQHGGRPQGRKIKRSITMAMELLQGTEITPLEFLLGLMTKPDPTRDKGEPLELYFQRRMQQTQISFEAAKAAAPFMHPKVGNIDPKEFRDEKDLAKQIAEDLREMMRKTNGGE